MMSLKDKVVWITGAGSGIGEAAARALGSETCIVVLTGRHPERLEKVAAEIRASGGTAHVQAGDLTDVDAVMRIAAWIRQSLGRLDILINNAGLNIMARDWSTLTPKGVDEIVSTNLAAAFYCVMAVLPIMRQQKDGLFIHTSSWAGKYTSLVTGPTYSAAKSGLMTMSESINMEECINGIRSCVICPAEVATPIMDKRPVKMTANELAQMLQPADLGDLIRYVAGLPPHICLNEVVISPTWNRAYVVPLKMPGRIQAPIIAPMSPG
jgi:NADP-dependent 3-hydroxy acid dehydrogenase YdfG